MSDYTIRAMNARDAKQLASLDKLCFSVPWSEQSFTLEAENNMAHYLVACTGSDIIGYIGYWNVIDEGHITNIAVAPEYRRQGVASALLARIVRKARSQKLILLTLEVRKSNSAARALYESFGFKPIGERRDYYRSPRENAVIMTLMLGEE